MKIKEFVDGYKNRVDNLKDKYIKDSFALLSDIFFNSQFDEIEMEKEKERQKLQEYEMI